MAIESNGSKRPANPVGIYRHEESGNELHVIDPIQGDAAVRLGYVRVGDLPKRGEATKETKEAKPSSSKGDTK